MSRMVSSIDGYSFVTDLAYDAERLVETHTRLTAEIEAAKVDRRYSDEHRESVVASKESGLTDYLAGTLGKMFDEASSEYAKLKRKRAELVTEARLSDPLNEGQGVQNAVLELEGLAGRADSFSEFKAAYEGAMTDPYLRRAYQLKGAAIARERWRGEVGVGSFERQLAADRVSSYETPESQAVTQSMSELHQGVKQATDVARRLYREATGVVGLGSEGGTYFAQFERLASELFAELHPDAGDAHGGAYLPEGSTEKWIIQGEGSLMGPG